MWQGTGLVCGFIIGALFMWTWAWKAPSTTTVVVSFSAAAAATGGVSSATTTSVISSRRLSYPELEDDVANDTVSLFSAIFESGDPDNVHQYNEKLWRSDHRNFDVLRLFNGNMTHDMGGHSDSISPRRFFGVLLSHALATNWGRSRVNASHPAFLCSPVTAVDFRYFLRSTIIDVPVLSHLVIVDGYDAYYVAAFLFGVRQALYRHRPEGAPDYFRVVHRRTIYGVSGNWNLCLTLAFQSEELAWARVPYVMIKNADSVPVADVMAPYARQSLDGQAAGKFFVFLFSHTFFSMTRTAYERLGLFDENFYPAYHEDTDIVIRSIVYYRSVGKSAKHFESTVPLRTPGKLNTIHAGSPSAKAPGCSLFKEILAKKRQVQYLQRKWNSSDVSGGHYYPAPFNNSSLDIGWWRLDEPHRACLVRRTRSCPLSQI